MWVELMFLLVPQILHALKIGAFTRGSHIWKVLSFKSESASDGSVNTLASDHFQSWEPQLQVSNCKKS